MIGHQQCMGGTMNQRRLLAIVSVNQENRVRCMFPNCNHPIHKRIYVVDDAGDIKLIGSTCITKDGYAAGIDLSQPAYSVSSGNGRELTEEERQILISNTHELLARLKNEYEAQLASEALQALAMSQALAAKARPTNSPPSRPTPAPMPPKLVVGEALRNALPPWPWVDPLRSVLFIQMADGSSWLRVQSRDSGSHHLIPYPEFVGWQDYLPSHLGHLNSTRDGIEVPSIGPALMFLRAQKPVCESVCRGFAQARQMARQYHPHL